MYCICQYFILHLYLITHINIATKAIGYIEIFNLFIIKTKFFNSNFNTFASQHLVFEEKKPFFLENRSNMTHEFFSYKNSCDNLNAFSRQNGQYIFPQKQGAEKRKC